MRACLLALTCIRSRILNNPLSGFGCTVPHSGPPALPKNTASTFMHFCSTSSVTESPCLSREQPPQRSKSRSKCLPVSSSMMSRTFSASVMTSGPTWSPGRTRILPPVAGVEPSVLVPLEVVMLVEGFLLLFREDCSWDGLERDQRA